MNVQGFGAGVGRVAPYYEQGNWYRGGAVQMLFIAWLYGEQNQVRPMFPRDTPRRRTSIEASRPVRPRTADATGGLVEGALAPAGAGHLPERRRPARHLRRRDAGPDRRADDPARAQRSCLVQGRPLARRQTINVPGLWFMSWYDVSVGPNLATYNHVRRTAKPGIARSAVGHHRAGRALRVPRATEDTVVGERSMGDARLDYSEITYGFFDRFLKGEQTARLDDAAEGDLFHDGLEQVADVGHVAARGRAGDDLRARRAAARPTRSSATVRSSPRRRTRTRPTRSPTTR